MSYSVKTNWSMDDIVLPDDFNRIEGNIQHLQDTKETPTGAQVKADAALVAAKQYTDQEVGEVTNKLTSHKNDNTRHISSNIPATAITFGGKFKIAYNSTTNSLDITVVG